MLALTRAGNIFHDWATYATTLGGMLLLYGTIYIRVIYPRAQAHKKHEAEREALRAENQRLNDKVNALPEKVALIEWWIACHEKAP